MYHNYIIYEILVWVHVEQISIYILIRASLKAFFTSVWTSLTAFFISVYVSTHKRKSSVTFLSVVTFLFVDFDADANNAASKKICETGSDEFIDFLRNGNSISVFFKKRKWCNIKPFPFFQKTEMV